MFEKIICKIAELIDLKSILTVLVAVTLCVIIFANIQIQDDGIKTLFISITSAVFTSYFQKKNKNDTGEK